MYLSMVSYASADPRITRALIAAYVGARWEYWNGPPPKPPFLFWHLSHKYKNETDKSYQNQYLAYIFKKEITAVFVSSVTVTSNNSRACNVQ